MKRNISNFNHKKLVVIVIFLISILSGANLLVSNILATSGEQLRMLRQRKENLVEQNSRLREQVISFRALETIDARAQDLGLYKTENILSLSSQTPVAMHQP